MRKALVVGGSNGIGQSIVLNLKDYEEIVIVDKQEPDFKLARNMKFEKFDLTSSDFSVFLKYLYVDTLIITSGYGKLKLFQDLDDDMIINSFTINTVAVIRLIKIFYNKINSKKTFYCTVMVSISGYLSSPFFSVYGATKAALCKFIESVNVELIKSNSSNKILNVSPGFIKGTNFYKKGNNLELMTPLANQIIKNMELKNDLFIPEYEKVFKNVLKRYNNDFRRFGLESYEYKVNTGKTKK